jgi:hypothetical protein
MIIGLSGWARSGKDTVANHLVENHGFVKMAFADPMREALYRLNPSIQIGEVYGVHLASAVDSMGWEELKGISPDIRPLLQRLGTEVGRQMFGENIWVDLAMKAAAQHSNVVFADCRFQNEADAIRSAGGSIWRIERPGVEAVNDHISEHELDEYAFDATLKNLDDVESLGRVVDQAIEIQKMLGIL